MAKPSIAFLVLAHEHPAQLRHLVCALRETGARFFVHIDRKVDAAPFRAAVADLANVQFDAQPVTVNWAAYSAVEATLRLIEMARSVARFSRYVLLSGVCYPCRPGDQLMRLLDSDREFIDAREIAPSEKSLYFRISRHHLNDHPLLNQRPCAEHPEAWATLRAYIHGYREKLPELPDLRIPYRYGMAFWALTETAIGEVLRFVHGPANADVMRRFRYSFCPDEALFQTIIGNSSLMRHRAGALHYVDWSEASKAKGKLLGSEHLPAIRASGRYFVRKMHPELSAPLREDLDRIIRTGGAAGPNQGR